jgi:flagellar protein FliO/FliZ
VDTVTLIGRLLVSLAAVLGVVWLISRRMRKTGRGRASGLIEVLDRRQLSRNSSVAVVRVGDQALVIGVTDNQVSVLAETDADKAVAISDAARPVPRVTKAPGRAAASRHRGKATPRPAARAATVRTSVADDAEPTDVATETPSPTAAPTAARTSLAGSALSPQTWKQTIESLREMTAR